MISAILAACVCACVCLSGESYEFPGDQLTFDLGKLKDVTWSEEDTDSEAFATSARCVGTLRDLEFEVTLRHDPTTSTKWLPRDVLALVQTGLSKDDPGFFFPRRVGVPAQAGKIAYLLAGIDNPSPGGDPRRALLAFCGVTNRAKYAIEVRADGPLTDKQIDAVTDWVADGLSYDGEARDPKWTDAELQELWHSVAPDDLADDLDVLRTKHFVILTNASTGKSFAKSMEECYDRIQEVFPGQELDGFRLLPVLLFRSEEQYIDFYVKVNKGATREQADRTGGSCEGEYYATWYESTQVRDHIYLTTQQVVRNRHWLTAGGTWFRVGLGEYLENSESERKQFARVVEKNEFVPLSEFMLMRSFSLSTTATDIRGRNTATELYRQAAALVEFLVESKFSRKRYVEFFSTVGNTDRDDRGQLERVLRDVLDTDLEGLEAEFVDYWKKR